MAEDGHDRRTANPIVNLVMWLLATAILVAVAATAGGRLLGIVGALLTGPAPLASRIAMAVGLGVPAVFLVLFFAWLLMVLVRKAAAYLGKGPRA